MEIEVAEDAVIVVVRVVVVVPVVIVPVVVVAIVSMAVIVIVVVAMVIVKGVAVPTVDMVIVVVVFVIGPARADCEDVRGCRRESSVSKGSSDSSDSRGIHDRAPGRFLRRLVGERCRYARSLAAAGVVHVGSAFACIGTPAAHAIVVSA